MADAVRCSRCDGAETPRHPLRPVAWHLVAQQERRRWRLERESGAPFRVCSECHADLMGGPTRAPGEAFNTEDEALAHALLLRDVVLS